jgi:hypothetical protein
MCVKFSRVYNVRQNVSGANDIAGRYSEILDYHNVDSINDEMAENGGRQQ